MLSEVGVDAHIPGTAGFVIDFSASDVHITFVAAGRLCVTRAPGALVEDVIHVAGQATFLVTSQVALRPRMLYGLISFFSLPVTGCSL